MAVTDAYASAAEYRAVLSRTDTSDDADILTDLKSISRYIERRTGRFFTVDASDVKREYHPRTAGLSVNPEILFIDDLSAAPTEIIIDTDLDGVYTDETALASTDYVLLPLNAADGPEPQPYTSIKIPSWSTKTYWSEAPVRIDGLWGWPSIPSAIKAATIQLATLIRMEGPRSTRRITEIGDAVETSPEAGAIVHRIVSSYMKRSIL